MNSILIIFWSVDIYWFKATSMKWGMRVVNKAQVFTLYYKIKMDKILFSMKPELWTFGKLNIYLPIKLIISFVLFFDSS